MRVKLTDLLDDLELDPELLPLPEAKRPTRARTERLVLQRLGISRRRVRSAGRTLLAAVIAALLSLAAVAGALGLLEISRADLGVTQPEKIPEYAEYEAASQDAGARLVSSFCAGKRLIAYVDVPDVTAEMNRAYQEAMDTYGLSLWSCRAKPYSVWAEALTYDESLQTALLRVELYTYEALEPGEVTIELCFDSQENGHETAGEVFATVTVPVLPSEALQAAPELSVPSAFLEASAVIGSLTLDAGTLRLTLQAPTLDSYLNARGDGALDTLVKGYFGQDTENPTELDAQVAYVAGVVDTWSVNNEHGTGRRQFHGFAHRVGGGAGHIGHYGDGLVRQRVHQAGLAGVAHAEEDDVGALAGRGIVQRHANSS